MRSLRSPWSAVSVRPCEPSAPSTTGPIQPWASGDGGAEHDRTARVGEQRRRAPVPIVGDAGDEVGADQQHVLGAAALDLSRGHRQPGEEPGAGSTDVVGAGMRGARAHAATSGAVFGVSSSCVRVATITRSSRSAGSAGRLERSRPPRGGVVAQALLRRGPAALADPGAAEDPRLVDPERGGELGARLPALGELDGDRLDAGPGEAGLGRSPGPRAASAAAQACASSTPGTVRLARPVSTRPGPTSRKRSAPNSRSVSIVSRQRTGRVERLGQLGADIGERRGGDRAHDGRAARAR